MMNKKGFTLTEILLAVMIVGLIGISLASLTRSASRESAVGRSKIMLRNNLSTFMRTLREDMASSSFVNPKSIHGSKSIYNNTPVVLIQMAQNSDTKGNPILPDNNAQSFITYCFVRGNETLGVYPSNATRGGKIYRIVETGLPADWNKPVCPDSFSSKQLLLDNVKYIGSTSYFSPLFSRHAISRQASSSSLQVKVIVELDSTPIVNEVIEEVFTMPNGY